MLPNKSAEMIYPYLSTQFFGPLFYGILMSGIFAAILSTADSQLLVVSSTVVRDFYQEVIRKGEKLDEVTKPPENGKELIAYLIFPKILTTF